MPGFLFLLVGEAVREEVHKFRPNSLFRLRIGEEETGRQGDGQARKEGQRKIKSLRQRNIQTVRDTFYHSLVDEEAGLKRKREKRARERGERKRERILALPPLSHWRRTFMYISSKHKTGTRLQALKERYAEPMQFLY